MKALVGKIATGDLFVGDSETKAAIEAKCAPDCVEMEGAAVSQIAAKNGVPCVILRAMSDNADEDGHEVLGVKKCSISEYVALGIKALCLLLGALGIAGMWAAIFADVGVMVIAVLNAMRALHCSK